ncbi:flagellar MS-ring protein [compost metagenome]
MVGKERAEIEHAAGGIERISVGVVLAAPQPEAGLKEMRNLLQATLGLDTTRGDQLVIAYLPRSPAATAAPATVTPAEQAPTAIVANSEPVATPEAQTPWLRWAVSAAAGLLSVTLLSLWLRVRKRARRPLAAAQLRLTSVEREQLLVDLRRWLAEVR